MCKWLASIPLALPIAGILAAASLQAVILSVVGMLAAASAQADQTSRAAIALRRVVDAVRRRPGAPAAVMRNGIGIVETPAMKAAATPGSRAYLGIIAAALLMGVAVAAWSKFTTVSTGAVRSMITFHPGPGLAADSTSSRCSSRELHLGDMIFWRAAAFLPAVLPRPSPRSDPPNSGERVPPGTPRGGAADAMLSASLPPAHRT